MHRQATSGQNLVLVLCLLPALFMQIPRPRCMWTIDRYSSSERIILTMFCVEVYTLVGLCCAEHIF